MLARLDDGEEIKISSELDKITSEWDELTLNMPAIPKKKIDWKTAIGNTEKEIHQKSISSQSESTRIKQQINTDK